MEERKIIKELNKILTLEHGHLGMYKNFLDYSDQELRRTFRRFAEIEIEHINKVKSAVLNMGGKPSTIVEGGDIIGRLFGITINLTNVQEVVKTYSWVEKKSHQGYADFVSKLEQSGGAMQQFIAEIAAANMLESRLMHLWLDDKLKSYGDHKPSQ
ncbi:hypothetical protein [Desulfoscipio gibsoniae]|uniref:DUF2383 domain-containing protein n=1 Tax=Desulfoscipio gibsoniae DSM 7213 TaxID=767817 RepID=R4KCW0_9FIRM|nr:hypothetical protein [Desulfoscipio gibsoniae]AGL00429.1 hypothetical protein Desgi_0881 [Desulfoscipio gibsoniae DSM 7213]